MVTVIPMFFCGWPWEAQPAHVFHEPVRLSSCGRNLEFVHGAGKSSPTRREHRGTFNIHQLILADRTPDHPFCIIVLCSHFLEPEALS